MSNKTSAKLTILQTVFSKQEDLTESQVENTPSKQSQHPTFLQIQQSPDSVSNTFEKNHKHNQLQRQTKQMTYLNHCIDVCGIESKM